MTDVQPTSRLKSLIKDQLRNIAPVFTLLALVIFFTVASSSFFTMVNFMNILSQISITATRTARQIDISVKDNGPGIPREYHQKIFERFFRVDQARSRAQGGAGLGLAIAKQAVERNGGRIMLENNSDGGSVFRIHFET